MKEQLDKIDQKLGTMNETLIRNTVTLEEHVRRTNLLEDKMQHVEHHVDRMESWIDKIHGGWKLVTMVAIIITIVIAILKIGE